MSFDVIQMPSKYLKNTNDPFSWRLHVLSISANGKSTAVVGRHSACDFRIDPKEFPCFISRKHAQFDLKEEKLYVKDLGSANGTFKNDVMLTPNVEYALSSGDYVAFGSKREQKTVPGEAVQKQDTPFLFKVMKADIFNTNVAKTMSSRESGETSATFNNDVSTRHEEKRKQPFCAEDNPAGASEAIKKRKFSDTNLDETVANNRTLSKSLSLKSVTNSSDNCSLYDYDNVCKERCSLKDTNAQIIYNKTIKIKKPEKKQPKKRKTNNLQKIVKKELDSSSTLIQQKKVKANGPAEQCASFECRISSAGVKEVINWVQCDSCDQWFHTICVGCDYSKVSDQAQQFHCGFCKS